MLIASSLSGPKPVARETIGSMPNWVRKLSECDGHATKKCIHHKIQLFWFSAIISGNCAQLRQEKHVHHGFEDGELGESDFRFANKVTMVAQPFLDVFPDFSSLNGVEVICRRKPLEFLDRRLVLLDNRRLYAPDLHPLAEGFRETRR